MAVLQPRVLYLLQRCLHGQEARTYFSKHAAALVPLWFDTQVRLMVQAVGTTAVELPNLKLYTDILGMMRFEHMHDVWYHMGRVGAQCCMASGVL